MAAVLTFLLGRDDPLQGLGTGAGALAFLWLWGVSAWTTGEALKPVLAGDERASAVLAGAAFWGGATGVLFLAGLALGALAATRELAFLFVLVVGSAAAGVVGAFVGFAAGLLDLGLLALARRAAR